MSIKSILDSVMSISEPVNEGLYFHIMTLTALVSRMEFGTLKGGNNYV